MTRPDPIYVNRHVYREMRRLGWDVSNYRVIQLIPLGPPGYVSTGWLQATDEHDEAERSSQRRKDKRGMR